METPKYTTALIVGAGEGLSASLARLFAREGIRVALAARQIGKLGALCSETGAHAFACNATDPDEVERLFGLVEREISSPDVMVYNASARARGPFVDLVPAEVAQAITVSAFGGFLVAQQAAKRMLPNKHGARIVAAGHSRRSLRHRWRHSQRGAGRARRTSGLDARPRCHRLELLERAATAAQRLDLGAGGAAVAREILEQPATRCAALHRRSSRETRRWR